MARKGQCQIFLTLNGETKSLLEWAEQLGIKEMTLRNRLNLGWSNERVLTTPVQDHSHNWKTKYKLEYETWSGMKSRCLNPNDEHYKDWGGRGIKVCDRWLNSFENFLEDMGQKPTGHLIDRIDVNGNYEPSNCRWASHKVSTRNKRNNKMLTYNGETLCMMDWAAKIGLRWEIIQDRLNRGWTTEETLSTPTGALRRDAIYLSYQGKTLPLVEWAKTVDIPLDVLRERIRILGWNAERALTTPHRKRRYIQIPVDKK